LFLHDAFPIFGLVQLEKLQLFNQKRAELVRLYNERITEARLDLILPFAFVSESKKPSYHIYPVIFGNAAQRDAMTELLKRDGIQTSIHYSPIHHFSAYRAAYPDIPLPVTHAFA